MKVDNLSKNNLLKFLLLITIIVVCIYLGRIFQFDIEHYRKIFSSYPVFVSFLIFVLLYVLTTTFIWFGPKDVFRISGAILFGPYISTVFVCVSEFINAVILFLLSRNLGREYVQEKFRIKQEQIKKANNTKGFWGIFALRVNLLIPLRFLDLSFGLSQVSLKKYLFVSFLSLPFRILLQQYIFSTVGMGLFTDMKASIEVMSKDVFIVYYCFIYSIILIVSTVVGSVSLFKRQIKGSC